MGAADGALRHAKIRALHDYWISIHPSKDRVPGRRNFDPMAVPTLLPNMMLLDVAGRPPRFRYRLVGTRMVEALGRDLTGQWLDEAHAHQDGTKPQFPSYERVAIEGRPEWRRGRPHFAGYIDRCTEMERIFLPLSSDGAAVDMLLTIAVFFDVTGREL
jgi:hypothetical protein